LASSERQLQLERAAEEWTEASGQPYQEMQARYREMRHLLFTFLTAYSDAELNLRQDAQGLQDALDAGSTIKLNALSLKVSPFLYLPDVGKIQNRSGSSARSLYAAGSGTRSYRRCGRNRS
jgi:hypothetical protein